MANKGFFCLDGYLERIGRLSDEEVGRLFRACMVYHATGEVLDLDGREGLAFDFIRADIDAANEAYEAKCNKNKANAESRWADTIVCDRMRPDAIAENRVPEDANARNIKEKEKVNVNTKEKKRESLGGFDQFWALYPKKVAKQDAVKAWAKIRGAELPDIMDGLRRWINSGEWARDDGRYIPHPATWLNGRRWEDEVSPRRSSGGFEQRDYSDVPRLDMEALAAEVAAFKAGGN